LSAANQTYGGRYAVIERVGVGGMAEVYRARDELLGREVAVKVLSERHSSDSSFVERFKREAQAAANLNHPNIVSLYDYGSEGTTNFIVMEFIDGDSLGELITQEAPLLPERAAEIAGDVAKALERAHNAGLVHRDIKPNNIMLTSTGQTKVTDFGIVRALGGETEQQMTQTGMVIGTAAYLSPEQAQGNPVDARSDVYALGIVLYEMLTGTTPFTGDTPLAVAYKHVREAPEPPSSKNPDVPEDLDAITMKALAKNPENRYSSATEMREDLERFTAGQRVHATPLLGETMAATAIASGTQVMRQTEVFAGDDEEPGRSRAGWYVVIALLILGLFGLVAYLIANNMFGGGELVRVPDVVGMTEDEATEELEAAGFSVEVDERPSEKDEGEVIKQDPKARERLEEGETVTIIVSSGVRQVEVPDVEGLKLNEARELIEAEGLKVEITPIASDEFEENEVISQSPPAGTEVDVDSTVDLEVSSGPEAVLVPDVINQSQDSAVAELDRVGLVASVETQPSNDVEEGLVIAQDPDPGTEVDPGDEVVILVSEGPEPQPMPNVIGQDGGEAEAMLESEPYLLNVSVEETVCPGAVPPGEVCEQEPAEGTEVEPGDSAVLYIQEGSASLGAPFALLAVIFGGFFA
jgi:beta-lactam-binding protein with PASTA domain/tRNA A-37 threonylcarbamoyl transferase component Bud32